MATHSILVGDCVAVMATLEPDSVDAIVCDPPYDLTDGGAGGFMGKAWDGTGVAFDPATWRAAYRVLKPGAHLIAFGGTRTYHRMAVAIEDAGFEIRDQLQWLYGSGFPKSHNVSKAIDKAAGATREVVGSAVGARNGNGQNIDYGAFASAGDGRYDVTAPATPDAAAWDGWGTALKPAHEPIVLARKLLSEKTVAANVLRWGTGALNIDAGRVGLAAVAGADALAYEANGQNTVYGSGMGGGAWRNTSGRWPANVILSHSLFCVPIGTRRVKGDGHHPAERGAGGLGTSGHAGQADLVERHAGYETVEAWECDASCPVAMLDAQSGQRPAGSRVKGTEASRTGDHGIYGTYGRVPSEPRTDSGGASRFFYTAKASSAERNAGLDAFGEQRGQYRPNDPDENTLRTRLHGSTPGKNTHPTVKPIAIMRYLIGLVVPAGGVVLDPFMGSGTTLCAAALAGVDAIGIDKEVEYADIARARLAHWAAQ